MFPTVKKNPKVPKFHIGKVKKEGGEFITFPKVPKLEKECIVIFTWEHFPVFSVLNFEEKLKCCVRGFQTFPKARGEVGLERFRMVYQFVKVEL